MPRAIPRRRSQTQSKKTANFRRLVLEDLELRQLLSFVVSEPARLMSPWLPPGTPVSFMTDINSQGTSVLLQTWYGPWAVASSDRNASSGQWSAPRNLGFGAYSGGAQFGAGRKLDLLRLQRRHISLLSISHIIYRVDRARPGAEPGQHSWWADHIQWPTDDVRYVASRQLRTGRRALRRGDGYVLITSVCCVTEHALQRIRWLAIVRRFDGPV